jgi:hypothetical protein
MKKIFGFIVFVLLLSISGGAFAAEKTDDNKLTGKEKKYLASIGLTQGEVSNLPVEVAKQLVADNATLADKHSEVVEFYEGNPTGDITTQAIIPSTTMSLWGTAYKVTSDRANNDKFYIYSNFQWLKTPLNTFVDKITFGWPSSEGFFLPTSNGSVTQHQHRYSQDPQGNGNWIDYAIDYSPSNFEPGAGVAGDFDLRASTSLTKHKGYMAQYVYVPTSRNGSLNIKIQYGHKKATGEVSVGLFPIGLGITPNSTVDTRDYALTIIY